MRVDPNAPAFAREMSWRPFQYAESSDPDQVIEPAQQGMSLRTYAAVQIAAVLRSKVIKRLCNDHWETLSYEEVADDAVMQADYLIQRLNKEAADA